MNDSGRHRDRPPPPGRILKRKATPSSSSSGSSSSSSDEEKSTSHTGSKRLKGVWPAPTEPRQDSGRSEFYGERPPHPSHQHNYDRNTSNSASASSGSSNYYNQEESPSYDQQQQHQQNRYQERQELPSYDQQQHRQQNRYQERERQEPPSYDQQQHRQQNRYQESQEPPYDQHRHQSRYQDPSHDQRQQQRHHSRYQEPPSAYNHHQRNRHQEPSSAYHHRYQDRSQHNSAAPGGLAPVVARHYNAIEEKGLEAREDSTIVILRKYNNWAKSMNFNDAMEKLRQAGNRYNELVGLDFCCGKGGDLRKWEKSRMMKHVVFVDIAEVSLANCKERYEEIFRKSEELRERRGGRGAPFFTAEFIVLDCTKDSLRSKLSDPNMEFDLVSCQFSFHYSFESYLQAKQMLTNATENLKRGGYFIGTTVNADRMVKRRRQCGGAEFGNEVYHVRFECDEPYQTYGARYFFKLQDAISCPEFLVHFPTLIRLASGFNLNLVYKHPFEKFHEIHSARQEAKGLLNQMGALECYPPTSTEALRFDEKQYDHARRFVDATKAKNPDWDDIKVGTISAVEWEAIRLYIAFCFQKV